MLLNRLNNHLEQGNLPQSQCGFHRHRRTTDMIFAASQLQEKCQEMRTHLYCTFVDLTKAFHTVNHEGLWKIMQKFGCPEQFIEMVRQLHDGMMTRVTDNGDVSETFAVTNGVRQGCVLAPTLFSLMFSAMLMNAPGSASPKGRTATCTINGGFNSGLLAEPPLLSSSSSSFSSFSSSSSSFSSSSSSSASPTATVVKAVTHNNVAHNPDTTTNTNTTTSDS
nr:unnamed protein product [Spirometra erinaceieuropaei]